MFLLILNVSNDCIQLGMTVREGAVTFLPVEPPMNPFILVDDIRRISLNLANQISKRY